MTTLIQHHEWLSLIEISGPFVAVPVLKEAFPQGLEELDGLKRKRLRQAYDEWREALETDDPQLPELHTAWVDEVLSRGLELDEDGRANVLKRTDWCIANLRVSLPEHAVALSPDLAVVDEQRANKPLMLIHTYSQDTDLDAPQKLDGWTATPAERMVQLCRATGCRLALVTNGERWMLIDAPVGAVTTFASWYARIWAQAPITLQAFVHLLGIRRFFVDEAEQLPALFDRSLKYQDEVTEALGEQVRRAVEVLIQALDKADQDRDRDLLRDVKEPELYEAALTLMMRLVFLLAAEERSLLLLGDERYESNYAISTLRMQLRTESEEILERRWDAWSRLLATFRAVFGGIEHENLRLPALGGSLFDPDRFSFLEGRAKGSNWRTEPAKPLPIDNRTVLLLLEAIQQFQGRTLSYRALDVEQVGYVYEGLLERTVKRTAEVTLELDGTKNAKAPWIKLAELESAGLEGAARLADLLQDRSGSSASRIRNDLVKPVDDALADRLLAACHGDFGLRDRIKPFAHLVRSDPWGYPLVYPAGAFIVTTGSDRRETGTHYTPKSLTEAIVAETLTPIAYVGPAQGTPRADWALKLPAELLDLKICDPAMGSGAFLVQACRWLADRLVEAWAQAEAQGHRFGVDGRVMDADASIEPLPRDIESRTVIARRLIAERCLYGVDLNPLAVELAKLSIWLVTLAKGRPFGFLDHNLRCGDSLLGIHRLDQLTQLSMNPTGQGQLRLFGQNVEQAVREAIELRSRLREMPIRDIRDVEAMAHLDADARRRLEVPESIADAFIGQVFASGGTGAGLENTLASLAIQAGQAIDGDQDVLESMRRRSVAALSIDMPTNRPVRRPFHWPLEFSEVFHSDRHGFDLIVGNPPFLGGKQMPTRLGPSYCEALKAFFTDSKGAADLVAYFFRRAFDLLAGNGCLGLLATKSIAETATRSVGLDPILNGGGEVYFAKTGLPWPGGASVVVSIVLIVKGKWLGQRLLNGQLVSEINSSLSSHVDFGAMKRLSHGINYSEGVKLYGSAFIKTKDEVAEIRSLNSGLDKYLRRYVNGDVLNGTPNIDGGLFAIDFGDRDRHQIEGCDEIVEELTLNVAEERSNQTRQVHEHRPWLHWDKRLVFMESARKLSRIIACVIVQRHLVFEFVSPDDLYTHGIKLFADERPSLFAFLQSSIHEIWVRGASSKLGNSVRYSTSTSFDTFPFVTTALSCESLINLGEKYSKVRRSVAIEMSVGLTELYNVFHDPSETAVGIRTLRDFHRNLDEAVAAAYGWEDLDLDHGFHEMPYLPENDCMRFTIGETAQLEVLRRLSELNRQRYEEEVARGLHTDPSPRALTRAPRASSAASAQPSFDFEAMAATAVDGMTPATAIIGFLGAHAGWHAKADVLAATGITDGQWNAAIADLIASSRVERRGERRGARYRIQQGHRDDHHEGAS
ncbi:MAG: ATP phosphoribosyltransferase regulatory subunit [Burkholderiales bacterium]|nr:ATP phosphoribosyltransferase regulatory subunit [Burkholderiales bacterium]